MAPRFDFATVAAWGLVVAGVGAAAAMVGYGVSGRRPRFDTDLEPELARLWPIARRQSDRQDVPRTHPILRQRVRSAARSTGTAWDLDRPQRILVRVGTRDDVGGVYGTLAHEAAHMTAPADAYHGPEFWTTLVDLVDGAYGVRVDLTGAADRFEKQDRIEAAIRGVDPPIAA